MTNNKPLILFDQLSTEIIFEIFDYLSSNDIIYTFFHFNQRFNSIINKNYQRCFNYLETPTTNLQFWKNLLPIIGSQIQCLIVTTIDFCFSLDIFPNVKSIIICYSFPIHYKQLDFIFESEQFNKLNLLKIQSEIFYNEVSSRNSQSIEQIFLKKIFNNENSLKIFECLSTLFLYNSKEINNLIMNIHIHSLSLKCRYLRDVFYLLEYTPNLKYFNLIITSFYFNNDINKTTDLSKINLEKFIFTSQIKNKNEKISKKYFFFLTNLLKEFSSTLIYLSLNLNNIDTEQFQFNAILLQEQFLESMIQLKYFYLYVKLDQQPNDIENILLTFKNQFWFNHNWSIGTHGQYIYTLPFHFNKLDHFTHFDHIKSNNSTILNCGYTWYRITSIGWHTSNKLDFNLIKQIKIKMANLNSIIFTSSTSEDYQLIDNSYIDKDKSEMILDSITTVYCDCEFLEDIKQWFSYILPNVKHLVLSYSPESTARLYDRMIFSNKLDEYSLGQWITTNYVYFSNIDKLETKVLLKDTEDLNKYGSILITQLLESFKNSNTFIFHFYWNHHYSNIPIFNLTEIIYYLNQQNILNNYQIKHSYNYLQFVKKTFYDE